MSKITFVDKNDIVIGAGEKAEAIEKGIAHRIARIFVFNSKGELLIQKRSPHVAAPNVWDDSAAGHVDEGEDYMTAARRELQEELGIGGVELTEVLKYYTEGSERARPGVQAKRFNSLYRVVYDGPVLPNEQEIAEVKWIEIPALKTWMAERPTDFTNGFETSLTKYIETI